MRNTLEVENYNFYLLERVYKFSKLIYDLWDLGDKSDLLDL